MTTHLNLAVAQSHTLASTAATLAALAQTTQRAALGGADLILFPEAYLGGYPRGADFGCSVGQRTAAGREQFRRCFHAAVDLGDTPRGAGDAWVARQLGGDGEERRGDGTREELERIASAAGVFVVVGLVEKAGGSLYCGVVYVDPVRGCIGKRRKVMPTGTERLIWGQGSPSTLRAVRTEIRGVDLTLAAAVCWENYMPLLRASLYSQNVNIYLAPTADGRDSWVPLLRTIALEGRTFVLSANQCVREADLPDWIHGSATSAVNDNTRSAPDRNGAEYQAVEQLSHPHPRPPVGRRQSIVTKTHENHEITWPSAGAKSPTGATRDRRSSITIPEGSHEVCLPALSPRHSVSASQQADSALAEDGPAWSKAPSSAFASRGGSCIVGPDGVVLAGPLWEDTDGLLTVRVDLEECIRGRLDFDCAGSYSRNDSFELRVRGLDLNPP